MLIPFSADIWARLYGPYGVQDVVGPLMRLEGSWDAAIAKDLFWEKLYHQEDLYPVTYAAMPWLWRMSDREAADELDRLVFFSEVVSCAMERRGIGRARPGGLYKGLSLNVADHAHHWIAQSDRLREADLPMLAALEQWFTATHP